MIRHTFDWPHPVNLALLHLEMVAVFGEQFHGFTTSGGMITAHFADQVGDDSGAVPADVIGAAQAVLEAHDPNALTAEQEAAEREREVLTGLKTTAHGAAEALQDALAAWATLTDEEKDDVLRRLAQTQAQVLVAVAYLLRQAGVS